jgi:peptidoglycan L-alanyl-D-glutamate endopeptidase CwlK
MSNINPVLQEIIREAIAVSPVDFSIPDNGGFRTNEEQHSLYVAGSSKCDGYIKVSKHQKGDAFDVIAIVAGKSSFEDNYYFVIAGSIMAIASLKGVKLRWGGDWNGNGVVCTDQNFDDIGHFELI